MRQIIIVGAGLAGLSAAVTLAEQNIASCLISLQPSERAQSVLAEGGINAALDIMGENDTPEEHFADTMRGGVNLADPNAVAGLCYAAPDVVRKLMALGVPFQMENGKMIQRNFGGQKKKRTAYAKSSTGKTLMTAMIDEARKYEAAGIIRRFPHHEFLELLKEKGRCAGILLRQVFTEEAMRLYGPVILACGGYNGIFPGMTTGTTQNTGDALAELFAAGIRIHDPEFIQYHPTTVGIPGKRLLVTEAARGEGGRLFVRRNGTPWYFMEELYPELKNLMPRDVVSREMYRVARLPDCEDQVYLDLTGLSRHVWKNRLPDLREELKFYLGIDPAKTPVPVRPGIHFFMGGIGVDAKHRTSLPGLYAAGECACQYHGANRLGGNSLLGALYGGKVAAMTAAEEWAAETGEISGETVGVLPEETIGVLPEEYLAERRVSPAFSEKLMGILLEGLGILRDQRTMEQALGALDALAGEGLTAMEKKRLMLGRAMLLAALARKESRGSHTRSDYPERDDVHFRRITEVYRSSPKGEKIRVEFLEIPERTAETHSAETNAVPASSVPESAAAVNAAAAGESAVHAAGERGSYAD